MSSNKTVKTKALKNQVLTEIQSQNYHLVFSLLAAMMGVFSVYPFIGLADGFSRWNLAMEIVLKGRIVSDTLMSPVIPYLQAITYRMLNSFALYTFLQSFLFYLAVGSITRTLLKDKIIYIAGRGIYLWNVTAVIVILYPSVFVFPLMLTDSSPIFALIVCFFSLLRVDKKTRINGLLKWGLLFLIVSLCVGIRINSIILFFIVLIVYVIRERKNIKLIGYYASAIIAGIFLGIVIPNFLLPNSHNACTLGMIWEMTAIAAENDDAQLLKKLDAFGDAQEALNRYGEPYLNSLVWDNNPPFPAYDISGKYATPIVNLYIKEFTNNTLQFIRIKIKFALSSLGISSPLITSRRGIHGVDDITISYGAMQSDCQNSMRELFFKFTDGISIISLRPIVAFLFCGLLCCITRKNEKKHIEGLQLLGLAMAYYLSFLINTQAFEFRYYAPSFYIVFTVIVSEIIKISMLVLEKVRRSRNL